MIPIRVAAKTTAHCPRAGITLNYDHPLVTIQCPVCDESLGNGPVTLVYVGTAPSAREGAYWTGSAVAVHSVCAPPNAPTE